MPLVFSCSSLLSSHYVKPKNARLQMMRQGVDYHKTVEWWDVLTVAGLDLGYYPNAGKCWLVTKPDKEETAVINIITEGRKHLGAAPGSRFFLDQDGNGKVE